MRQSIDSLDEAERALAARYSSAPPAAEAEPAVSGKRPLDASGSAPAALDAAGAGAAALSPTPGSGGAARSTLRARAVKPPPKPVRSPGNRSQGPPPLSVAALRARRARWSRFVAAGVVGTVAFTALAFSHHSNILRARRASFTQPAALSPVELRMMQARGIALPAAPPTRVDPPATTNAAKPQQRPEAARAVRAQQPLSQAREPAAPRAGGSVPAERRTPGNGRRSGARNGSPAAHPTPSAEPAAKPARAAVAPKPSTNAELRTTVERQPRSPAPRGARADDRPVLHQPAPPPAVEQQPTSASPPPGPPASPPGDVPRAAFPPLE